MAVKYLVSAEEMRKFDNYTIDEIGIPGMVLMERAALSVVNGMKTAIADLTKESMLVICGGGNNGGDGLAVARLLCDLNCKVDVVLVCSEDKCSEQTAQQLAIIKKYNQLYSNINLYINENMLPFSRCREYSIIVDAIFGVGLSRDIKGEYLKWIEAVNASDAYVVAVDVPSGTTVKDYICSVYNSVSHPVAATTAPSYKTEVEEMVGESTFVGTVKIVELVNEGKVHHGNTYRCVVESLEKGSNLNTYEDGTVLMVILKNTVEIGGNYVIGFSPVGEESLIYMQTTKESVYAVSAGLLAEIAEYQAD